MSKFTGKCDLYDSAFMLQDDPEDFVKNSVFYLERGKLDVKAVKDLIPYCTHLTAAAAYSKGSGNTIHLSRDSFIDSEERDFLSWKIIDAIKAARKAKKEKKTFDFEYLKNFCKEVSSFYPWIPIVETINKNPDLLKTHIPADYRKAYHFFESWIIPEYFSTLHDAMHNRFREDFLEFAKENGYAVADWDENHEHGKLTEGIYHPIISHMCLSVAEYYKTIDKIKKDYKASEEAYNIGG